MKKNVIVLAFLAFLSCSGEEDTNCNCGEVVADNVSDYTVIIRSDCSGKEKKFRLKEGDWINAHPGMNYCISSSEGW